MSKFDAERFAKVHALIAGGATEGERAAARARAEHIAAKAGMTFSAALDACGLSSAPPPTSPVHDWREAFRDLFNTPEFRAREVERQKKESIERARVLREYGSKEAIFAETERETLLSSAVEHLKEWKECIDPQTGESCRYVSKMDGWNGCSIFDEIPQSILDAVERAYAVPHDLVGLFDEYQYWGRLFERRYLFAGADHAHEYWVQARILLLEHLLDTRPVKNWQDMKARLDWWQIELDRESVHAAGWEQALRNRIAEDHEILRAMSSNAVQNGQSMGTRRTNSDKADTVADLLRQHPNLSNREIARRAGVSPQTVLNWRNRMTRAS